MIKTDRALSEPWIKALGLKANSACVIPEQRCRGRDQTSVRSRRIDDGTRCAASPAWRSRPDFKALDAIRTRVDDEITLRMHKNAGVTSPGPAVRRVRDFERFDLEYVDSH